MDLVDTGILVVVFAVVYVVDPTKAPGLSFLIPVLHSHTHRIRRIYQLLRPLRCERGLPTLTLLGLHPLSSLLLSLFPLLLSDAAHRILVISARNV